VDRTSSLWYAIGALIIIGGMVGAIVGAVHDLSGMESRFTRFAMPGSVDLHLAQPGPYIIYYERRSVVDGEIFQTPEVTDIKCTVTSRGGEEVAINPTAFSATYSLGGREGTALAEFSAPSPGTYKITCAYPSGKGTRIALAIAPSFGGATPVSVLMWAALAFGSLGLGLVVLIVTLVRSVARRGSAHDRA
jgi:hypothetical protein